jgi:muramoyltetrapeptide carboxypeptidase
MDPQSARTLAAGTLRSVVAGTARGPLFGGTISLLAQSAGTADQLPATGAIAVLEDVGEPTYRLDSLITQLLRTGWFDGVAGVVLGTFEGCGRDAEEVVAERLSYLGVPLATGLPFGHGRPQLTVPLGVETDLDVDAGTLVVRQPALR